MKKALIDPNVVTDNCPTVVNVLPQEVTCYPPNYWLDCPDDVLPGYYYKDATFYPPPTPAPTLFTVEQNKELALTKLKNSDWVELPSVSDPTSTPYLLNKAEWIAYRNAVRGMAVNPVAGNLQWPSKPTENWS
jgi:hypothetical protein